MTAFPLSYTFEDTTMEKTVTIELRLRFKDEKRFEIVRKAAAKSAAGLLAAASLIADSNHKPIVALTAFDLYSGKESIKFMETDDE